jgi:alpha-mannosidase
LVRTKDNSVVVFNSLNWARSGIVETDLPDGTTLVDSSTGNEVPVETLYEGKGISLPGFGPGNVRVRFLAAAVPAVGYKLYAIRTITKERAAQLDVRGNIIENEFYRVTLDPASGAISNVFDKQVGRELVDPSSPYKFGQYLYVTGGDSYPENSLYRFGAGLKPPALTVNAASSGTLVSAKKTPIGIVATLGSSVLNTPSIQTEILLPDSTKVILITYHLHKDRVLTRESAYIAFPFAVTTPAFTYGSQSAWINPEKDELAGGSREWYLPTTWASVSNSQVAATVVPLDAPLVAFGDIVRGEWPAEFKPKTSAIFSWLMNNYWGTNFPAWQGGDFTFRYAITSNAQFDAPSLTRFGLEALTPLERDDVPGTQDSSSLPSQEASLLEVGSPDVSLLTWKRAEDGDGTILRLQETAGKASNVKIRSTFLTFERAWLCNLLEDNQAEITAQGNNLSVSIKPFQVLTLRIHTVPRVTQGSTQ